MQDLKSRLVAYNNRLFDAAKKAINKSQEVQEDQYEQGAWDNEALNLTRISEELESILSDYDDAGTGYRLEGVDGTDKGIYNPTLQPDAADRVNAYLESVGSPWRWVPV